MRLKKNILGTILWRGLYFVTALLLNVIIARYFKAAGSGWVYYITNYFSFIILVASLSLESGMIYFASGHIIRPDRLAGFALLWSLVISLIIALLLFLFYKEAIELPGRYEFVLFLSLYTLGILLTTFFSALFYSRQNFELPNLLLAATNILFILAALVIIACIPGLQAHPLFLKLYFLNFLLQGVVLACAYFKKHNITALWLLPSKKELKMLFRYAIFALFANIVFFLLYRADYWFVKNDCPVCMEGDLGNYIQVSKLGQIFLVLPTMIANVLFPRTAAGFNKEVNSLLPVLSRVLFFLYLIAMLLLALTGQWFFPFVYGETFNKMYWSFLLLIPGLLALSSMVFISAYYAGKNKVVHNLTGASVALLVMVAGDILFIPYYGIRAAALVSTAGYLACYFYILWQFKKDYSVPVKAFFMPAKDDFEKAYSFIVKQFKEAG